MNIIDIEHSKYIDDFCDQSIFNKKFLKSCDMDLSINFNITAIYNYDKLISASQKEFINKNYSKNANYIDKIEKEKRKILDKMKDESNLKSKSLSSISEKQENFLNFVIPEFEVYFTIKLITNNIPIEPIIYSDLILNSNFREMISIKYKYRDLPFNSYLEICLYSMQLDKDDSIIGKVNINLFNEKNNLLQGKINLTLINLIL